MRVLITTDTIGGVWTFTKELTQGLLESGHSVALVSLGRMPDADQQAWAERTVTRSWGRFEYHPTDSPLEWMQNNADAFRHSASFLERLAITFHADLIHANQFCFGALATDIPVLITAHSDVLSWAQTCRPEALAVSPWLTQYKSLVQHGLYSAAAVVAPTHWMLAALAANFHLPAQRATIMNGRSLPITPGAPGLDSETWVSGESANLKSRKLQAVTAGRLWDEAKNLTLLTEINSPIPLLIAGEPPPEVSPHLTFTGHLPEQALLNLFAESAIYICPSFYEPFGLAPLEAALCGCAILANDIPTLREVWQDAALYFGDALSLERLLENLAADPDLLKQAQQRANERAQGLSEGRMTAGYVHFYRHILKAKQEPAHAA